MIRFVCGFLLGVYVTQNYNLPNLHDKFKQIEQELKKNNK